MSAPAVAVPVKVQRPIAPEEAARADFYALLARLLAAPPDAELLARLAAAPALEGESALARAWLDLSRASAAMDADAAAEEHENLFAGVGKAKVSVYAGYYMGAPAVDHPRVRIQVALTELGLARDARVTEPEDHYAGLFEVMRVLVAGGAGRAPAPVEEQRRFFQALVEPGLRRFFETLGSAPEANYYRRVAALGAAFAELESESFLLD